MSIDWRTTAIVAGAALVLSVLVGILGGVAFGTILVRGLLGAIAFGAGSVGIRYLVDRYLPELRQEKADQIESTQGSRVDIVVDDDPLEGELQPEAPMPSGADSEEEHDVEELDQVGELDEVGESEQVEGEEPANEPAEGADPTRENDEQEQQFRPGVNAEVLSSQESLPDMNSFSETFTELPTDAEVSEEEDVEGSHSGEDPSIMARAIQTVLKRGEE